MQVVGWPDSTEEKRVMAPEGSREWTVPHSPAIQSNIAEETLSILRDGGNNGYEIGENIAAIK